MKFDNFKKNLDESFVCPESGLPTKRRCKYTNNLLNYVIRIF
jgi:hypothetical protein